MGRIQPTCMAHAGVVLAEDTAGALERCDICHSIKHRSVPVVCKPDSPRVPTASEALGKAGSASGGHTRNMTECPDGIESKLDIRPYTEGTVAVHPCPPLDYPTSLRSRMTAFGIRKGAGPSTSCDGLRSIAGQVEHGSTRCRGQTGCRIFS